MPAGNSHMEVWVGAIATQVLNVLSDLHVCIFGVTENATRGYTEATRPVTSFGGMYPRIVRWREVALAAEAAQVGGAAEAVAEGEEAQVQVVERRLLLQ